MCLVGRAFVLMGSFSSVLVRSIFWGAFVDSFSVCLSDTILISICALAWFRFQKFEKSAVNGMLFRGLHSNSEIMPPMLVRFAFVYFFGGF